MTAPGYGFVLLAAGSSSRLGSPKGLLPYQDTTLLGHVLREMRKLPGWPIVVVTGAHAKQLSGILNVPGVDCIYNADWNQGMSLSISVGLKRLLAYTPSEGVIFTGCDQPAVTAELFAALVRKKESGTRNIVASAYSDTLGIPVLFGKRYFPELEMISGVKGAKFLLEKYAEDVANVPFPLGKVDIDTLEDYTNWNNSAR